MIARKLTDDKEILSTIAILSTPLLVAMVGWLLVRSVHQIDANIEKHTITMQQMADKFSTYEVLTEGRIGKVETEINFLDRRVDRLERYPKVAVKDGTGTM